MKRSLSILLIIAFLFAISYAEVPSLSGQMFPCAKNALTSLCSGNYSSLSSSAQLASIDSGRWSSVASALMTDSAPQTQYAVAYWNGSYWKLAVPVTTPSADSVLCLIMTSYDGTTFSYADVASWGNVRNEYFTSDYVLWQSEYVSAAGSSLTADQ